MFHTYDIFCTCITDLTVSSGDQTKKWFGTHSLCLGHVGFGVFLGGRMMKMGGVSVTGMRYTSLLMCIPIWTDFKEDQPAKHAAMSNPVWLWGQ